MPSIGSSGLWPRRALVGLGGAAFVLLFALAVYLLVYQRVLGPGARAIPQFPNVVTYLTRTVTLSGPDRHPLEAYQTQTESPLRVPYDRPLGRALEALARSLLLLGLSVTFLTSFSVLRALTRLGAERVGPLGTTCRWLRVPDWFVEQFQRLPGIIVYLLLSYSLVLLHRGEWLGGRPGTLILALQMSLIVANSDGLVPETASTLIQRYLDLSRRDYVKVGLLEGRSRVAIVRRELTMTLVDSVGSRILQIIGSAFLLELIFSYAGIGRTCILLLYQSSGLRGSAGIADEIAKADALYCVLSLMFLLSAAIILGRRTLQGLLDPRPRISVLP